MFTETFQVLAIHRTDFVGEVHSVGFYGQEVVNGEAIRDKI